MAQKSIRFGITDGEGRRAATWKLWTETGNDKSEVYLTCRSLGGTIKASMHESGSWHIAYSRVVFERDVKGVFPDKKDRFIKKWSRPADISPGITLVLWIYGVYDCAVEMSDSKPLD